MPVHGTLSGMETLIGNSARGSDLAWVRVEVQDDRVVSAAGDGPGVAELCRAVQGLKMLDAAAIPGEELALDALHDALGAGVRATARDGRVAVAMSGGVDS